MSRRGQSPSRLRERLRERLRRAYIGPGGGGCSVAERDIPYEVPELRYVEVDPARLDQLRRNLSNWWGDQTPIAICVRCGLHYTEDPNRDSVGEPMHEDRRMILRSCVTTAARQLWAPPSERTWSRSSTKRWDSGRSTAELSGRS